MGREAVSSMLHACKQCGRGTRLQFGWQSAIAAGIILVIAGTLAWRMVTTPQEMPAIVLPAGRIRKAHRCIVC